MDPLLTYEPGTLADRKSEYIERWARVMRTHPVLSPLDMTMRQRRVVASLYWWREVCKANDHMPGVRQQPKPIVGRDANGRIVVQAYNRVPGADGHLQVWAMTKDGDPADVKEPVLSIRTGERVKVPAYATVKSDRY